MSEPTDSNRQSRNKLYKSLNKGDTVYCGGYASKCNATLDDINCSTAWTDENNNKQTYPCPGGYIEKGRYSGGKKCGAYLHRECTLQSVNDPLFNPIETEFNKDEGKGRSEQIRKKVRACCSGTDPDPKCGNLYNGDINNEPVCKYDKQEYCLANLDNLSTDDCVEWCSKNRNACTTTAISKFCQDDKVIPTSKKYDRICGCYYKQEFYNKIQEEMSDKFKIPQEFLSGGRSCYFSGCNGSPLNPNPNEIKDNCKSISLAQCFQNIALTSANSISLGVNSVTQNAECKTHIDQIINKYSKSCTQTSDCPTGLECINKNCDVNPVTATPCTQNSECSGGLTCINNKCLNNTPPAVKPSDVDKLNAGDICKTTADCKDPLVCDTYKCATKPVDEPKSTFNLPLIIGLSVGGFILLLIIAGVLFNMKSSNSSSTGTVSS